jgi:polysaccharide deacetylase family protein (PEP-CTERM system associated)
MNAVHPLEDSSANRVRHHFTVDVEEYFHASALDPWVTMQSWPLLARRSPSVIARLLDLLAERSLYGTFFVVGWLAEREPSMVRDISRAGHEVASHSWDHRRVTHQRPDEFRESVRRAKRVLEDLTGTEVRGFRAPSWSIVPGFEWALDVLLEEEYRYDSSLFPIAHHASYGYPGAPRDPHWLSRPSGELAELPPATLRLLGTNIPASGGAYLRFFPFGLLASALRDAEERGQPGTFYIHPWELDDFVPDLPMSAVARLRTFGGLHRTWPRIRRLADAFRFQRMDETVKSMSRAGSQR